MRPRCDSRVRCHSVSTRSVGYVTSLLLLLAVAIEISGDTIEMGTDLQEGLWQARLLGASPNTTFRFQPGTYRPGAAGCNILLPLGARLVAASTRGPVIIDCQGAGRHFEVPKGASAILNGLTLRNGASLDDAGCVLVDADSTLDLLGCQIKNCTAARRGGCIYVSNGARVEVLDSVLEGCESEMDGGGVYALGAALRLESSTVRHCKAGSCTEDGCSGGGVHGRSSVIIVVGATLSDNSAGYLGGALSLLRCVVTLGQGTEFLRGIARYGGAVHCEGSQVRVMDTVVRDCSATKSGGGFYLAKGSSMNATRNVSFLSNRAEQDGGALRAYGDGAAILGNDIVFIGNSAGDDGGAVALQTTSSEPDGRIIWMAAGRVLLRFNVADDDGGGLYIYHAAASDLTIALLGNIEIDSCSSDSSGGGLFTYAATNSGQLDVSMQNNKIRGCNARQGGALYARKSQIVMVGGSFQDNSAEVSGGALYCDKSKLTISGSDFGNNFADESGGALYCDESELTISGSNFGNNTANDYGGMAYVYESTMILTTNVDVFDSVAGRGGAIYAKMGSMLELRDGVSLHDNYATSHGGALYAHTRSTVTLGHNTACLRNSAESDSGCYHMYHESNLFAYNSSFLQNTAGDDGGAVSTQGKQTSGWSIVALVGDVIFSENVAADRGGGMYFVGLVVSSIVGAAEFSHNSARDDGGAIAAVPRTGGLVERGIAVNISGAVLFRENQGYSSGGALFLNKVEASMEGISMVGNKASVRGGAFYLHDATVHIKGGTFHKNEAGLQVFGRGGVGLVSESSISISSSNLTENSAVFGGAVDCFRCTLNVFDKVVVRGNVAKYSAGFARIRYNFHKNEI